MHRYSLASLALACFSAAFVPDANPARAQTSALDLAPSVETVSGTELEALIERDFIAYDPDYLEHRRVYGERLHELASRLAENQATGNPMECSNQIFLEAKWLYHYTAYWTRLDRQLERLAQSLNDTKQHFATKQSPQDGSWGLCHDEWFLKVEATYTALLDLYDKGERPAHPIALADQLKRPDRALAHFESLLVSDIAKTGIDRRSELGGLNTIAISNLFKPYLQDFLTNQVEGLPRHHYPAITFQTALAQFLQRWQDPKSGYWGAWYRSRGKLYRSADLSITYHTIAYLRGDVDNWPQIIDTTFRIRSEPYPYGWQHNGHYNNHNNYDVAKIFRFGWPHMSARQRARAHDEIQAMLRWSLDESLTDEGTFNVDPTFFSSVADEFYFGVSFLDVIGYWKPDRRFWTSQTFPGSRAICCKIERRLMSLEIKTQPAQSALMRLSGACGRCAPPRPIGVSTEADR